MEKDLVSIITPCFNTGSYVHRLLDSVLNQTYPNIEMFVIDDGSTDNTAKVIGSYIPRFQDKGYSLRLISQENSGQSVAIKKGLKLINGKYVVWPDSDDFYASSSAIEQMVSTFEKVGDEYGFVRTQEYLVEDGSMKILGINGKSAKANCNKRQLFEDCLFGQNGFFFCPGAYMADFQKLKDSTTIDIYSDKNAGQNWQLMLPILYNYRCYTIRKPLYKVVVRQSSHSRGQYAGFDKSIAKITSYEQTLYGTLKRIKGMPDAEREHYANEIKKKYCRERISLSFKYRRKRLFEEYYKEGQEIQSIRTQEKILKILFPFPIVAKALLYIYNRFAR